MIFLNSPSAVRELFDKRGSSNSNRPVSIVADTIAPGSTNLGTGRYGKSSARYAFGKLSTHVHWSANEAWKTLRRAATQALNNDNIKKHSNVQYGEAVQLMWDLAHSPDVNKFIFVDGVKLFITR